MGVHRVERVSDLLLGFLGAELEKLNDPRIELMTLTGVEMSKDLKIAKVYWSLPTDPEKDGPEATFPAEERRKKASEALKGMEKLLKKRIAEELELRYVPALHFKFDQTPAIGSRIDMLLKKALGK